MAVTKDQLILEITANSAKAAQSIDQVTKSLTDLERQAKQSNVAQERSANSLTDLGAGFVKLASIVYVAKEAFDVMQRVYQATVGEFQKSQDNITKLANNLAIMGEQNIPEVVKAYKDLTDEIENNTAVDGEQLMKLAAMGVAMGRTDAQIKTLIKASVGLASVTDKDVGGAFQKLVMSYRGVARGLQDVLPQVGAMTQAQLKNGDAVKLASEELYGFAEAMLNTYEGQVRQAQIRIGDIMEEIGRIISSGIGVSDAARGFNELVGSISDKLKEIGPMLAGTLAFIKSAVGDALRLFGILVSNLISALLQALKLVTRFSPVFKMLGLDSLSKGIEELQKSVEQFSVGMMAGLTDPFKAATDALEGYNKLFVGGLAAQARERRELEMQVSDEALKLLEELANARKTFQEQANAAGATEIDQIRLKGEAERKNLDIMRQKLVAEKAFNAQAQRNYTQAIASIDERTRKEIEAKQSSTFAQESKNTEELNIQLAQYRETTRDVIKMREAAAQREIDDRIRILKVNVKENALAIKSLHQQKIAQAKLTAEQLRREPGQEFQKAKKAGDEIAIGINEAMTSGTMGVVNGAIAGFNGVMSAMQGYVDAAQQAVDAIPKLLNSISQLLNSITELPLKIAEGIANVFKGAINLVRNLLPNIINAVESIITSAISFVEQVPEAINDALTKAPDMFLKFIDKLPMLAEKLAEALAKSGPKISAKMAEFLIIKAPEIAWKLALALSYSVPAAIWHGILEGMKEFGRIWQRWMKGQFSDGIPMKFDTKQIERELTTLTQDASRIFTVSAIEDAAKNASNEAAKITAAAKKAGKDMWNQFLIDMANGEKWLREAGGKIWSGLNTAATVIGEWGTKIWNALLEPASSQLPDWGTKIYNGLIQALGDGLDFVGRIVGPMLKLLGEGLSGLVETVGSGIVQVITTEIPNALLAIRDGMATVLQSGAQIVTSALYDGVNALGSLIVNLLNKEMPNIVATASKLFTFLIEGVKQFLQLDFSGVKIAIAEAFRTGGATLENAFRAVINPIVDVFNGLINALNKLEIPELKYNISNKFMQASGTLIGRTDLLPGNIDKIQRFAQGGLVKGMTGTDNVPAFLSAGEFVMNRKAVASIGLDNLKNLNQGRAPMGNNVQNISLNLTIDTKDRLDENFVRQRLMPAIRDELKRGSLDGRAIVYAGGVRK